jgi:hypothetical protein
VSVEAVGHLPRLAAAVVAVALAGIIGAGLARGEPPRCPDWRDRVIAEKDQPGALIEGPDLAGLGRQAFDRPDPDCG